MSHVNTLRRTDQFIDDEIEVIRAPPSISSVNSIRIEECVTTSATEQQLAEAFRSLETVQANEDRTDIRCNLIKTFEARTEAALKTAAHESFTGLEEKLFEKFGIETDSDFNFRNFGEMFSSLFHAYCPGTDYTPLIKKHSHDKLETRTVERKKAAVVKEAYGVVATSHENREADVNVAVNRSSMGRVTDLMDQVNELCQKVECIPFYHLVINRKSWVQSIENIFDVASCLHSRKLFVAPDLEFDEKLAIYEELGLATDCELESIFITNKAPEDDSNRSYNIINTFTKQLVLEKADFFNIDECFIPSRYYGDGYLDPDTKTEVLNKTY